MSCTRQQILAQMQAWVGCKESDGSHKKIIEIYNSIDPLPVGYRLKTSDAWCAGTVSAAAQVCDAVDIFPVECSCPRMITKAQKMGIWVEEDNYVPQPGDVILYDWDDSGKGDNRGGSDHVGMVESVKGSTMVIIEGNYSNAVKRRSIQVNGRYIRGYVVPKYIQTSSSDSPSKDGGSPSAEVKKGVYTMELRQLKKGHTGEDVKALQILLNGRGYSCGTYGADGDFGSATESALKKYQKDHDLIPDGIAGPVSMASLLGA